MIFHFTFTYIIFGRQMYIFIHIYRKISIACMTVSPYSSSNNLLVQTEIGPSMDSMARFSMDVCVCVSVFTHNT